MTAIFESLRDITTGYSVFEKDQVLTHEQLNSLVGYTDDQVRLTRVKLLGNGLISGLRPRFVANTNRVHVSAGIGVTTDGDLLVLDGETVYTHFRVFDKARPVYPPLYVGAPEAGQLRTVYELLTSATGASGAKLLSALPGGATALRQMIVVAYMESYVKDDDLCTGTDCDNLGQDVVNHQLMLLVPPAELTALRGSIDTPADAYDALPQLSVGRPPLSASWTNLAQLASAYRAVCQTANNDLRAAFELLPTQARALGDILDEARPGAWTTRLSALAAAWANTTTGIQYYYDLLKDLTDTWNGFCEALFDDRGWLHAPPSQFPKHLLLGPVAGDDANPEADRTRFYPSPLLRLSPDTRAHASMLLRKIDAMLTHFEVRSDANQSIRVTPSAGEHQPLEARAVPIYYPKAAIVRDWSLAHRQRRTSARISSYNAGLWGSSGNPLSGQIARFEFFRIEGHIGRPVQAAIADLEALNKAHNLPFAVEAVMLHSSRLGLIHRRPPKYTDLHRLHYVIRQDVSHQLLEAERFGAQFKTKLGSAGQAGYLPPTPPESPTHVERAQQNYVALEASVTAARGVLDQKYSVYKTSQTWKGELTQTMQKAGELKNNFGSMTKTEFVTPLDTLLGNQQFKWLEWIDDLIDKRQADEDDKLLFGKFLAQHPGIDHLAGVTRGGTFVLVYDNQNRVVADFSLPYQCCAEIDEEPEQAPQPVPPKPIKPPWLLTDGIRFVPPQDKLINDRILQFKDEIEPKFQIQDQYNKFQDSYSKAFDDLINKAMATRVGIPQGLDGGIKAEDEVFRALADAAGAQHERVKQLEAAGAPVEEIDKAKALASRTVDNVNRYIEAAPSVKLGAAEMNALAKLPDEQRISINNALRTRGIG